MSAAAITSHERSQLVARLRGVGCVFAEEEADVLVAEARSRADLDAMVSLRATGEPLEYVVGWAEFLGLRISVEKPVFVPRRRTEFLALKAIERADAVANLPVANPVVLDLCCGSGAVGAAILSRVDDVTLHAVDIDPAAVRSALRNIGAAGAVYEGDLYDALPVSLHGKFDVIVANAPYVPTGDIATMPRDAREYEARVTLDGGADGLDIQRRIASEAPRWLAPGGQLLIETSRGQAEATAAVFSGCGLSACILSSDTWDATIVVGALG